MFFGRKKRIFLDYASTTPLDPAVFAVMKPYFSEHFSNPSSVYSEGITAKNAVVAARAEIARMLGVRRDEVFFTGSGTESNNLAIAGVISAAQSGEFLPHIVTTEIEHPSILETCRALEKKGLAKVSYVPVEKNGIVDPKRIGGVLSPETVLVSVMYANNEIGTIQPIHEISRVIRRYCKENSIDRTIDLHADASQAANYLSLDCEKLGISMMTLDASKFYGPKGVGILYKKRTVDISPVIYGGGQEAGLRSATENVPGIVGAAEALSRVQALRDSESLRLSVFRDRFISSVLNQFPKAVLNGDRETRLPNNINISFPGIFSEFLVVKLDYAGTACSSASACNNLSNDSSSYIVRALGRGGDSASSALRFTLGKYTTQQDMDRTFDALSKALA